MSVAAGRGPGRRPPSPSALAPELTEGAREERGGVLLEIKFKETIRTCLNQTGAKVSLNWARAIFQRTASLGEAVPLAAVQVLHPGRQLAAKAVDVTSAIDLRRAGLQPGTVRLQGLLPAPLRERFREPVPHSHWRRRNHRGTSVEPSRNPVNSSGFVTLATSEPSWNHRGTKREPCEFIRFRHTRDVGTIVEPSWNQAGTL